MHGKELFDIIAKGSLPPQVPFVPTVYEHCARILGKTPSQTAQDVDLLAESQLACYELYRHDIISVGLDIYNIEAEALGLKVVYPENEALPSIHGVLIESARDLEVLELPDPKRNGRMPQILEACRKVYQEIGHIVPVSGTLTGPFTLAAILRGFESFIMDMILDPAFALAQMEFAKKTALCYAPAFLDTGAGFAVNES